MNLSQTIIVGIVEGLTEFLPISSTAHMRITENLLGISNTDKFAEVFTVAIQLGAILSVVVLYWKKFFQFKNFNFYTFF
jgi:undecaprenyl-diphosphatase